MKSKYFLMLLSVAGLMLGAQPALAASAAVREMAGVMMNMSHYPSDAEKAKLKSIASDKGGTEQERVIAAAIANIKHSVSSEDVIKLKKVMDDMSAPAEVRDLAGIVLNFSHKLKAGNKSKLEMMAK